ncbi:hypothetical protein [Planctomyces sp. SH-PL62]|uniref:hypothetical protein n=1 Tax=Planctomyces sp. SH-PL62 TaxID=1636152 RepID=UPI00078B1E88|nr:hypothetical protein [Planctomyces sp. SH-PL62]AMV38784.1 hypothetical protein VT85_15205 [Planctomyces sp. SH-PL62]
MSTRFREWRPGFLDALARCGNVRDACADAGIHRSTAYERRAKDAAFAEAWDDAIDDAADELEQEARRRAVEGTERTRFVRTGTDDAGRPVYERISFREYSDLLLIFLLKAVRPEKYRDRYDVKATVAAMAGGREALDAD